MKPVIPLASSRASAPDPVDHALAMARDGRLLQSAALLRSILARDSRNGAARRALASLGSAARRVVTLTAQERRDEKAFRAAFDQGNWQLAVKLGKSLLTRQPALGDVANSIGVALTKLGRTNDALKAFDHALRVDPALPDSYLNLSTLLLQLGQKAAARDAAAAALDVAPEHAGVHRALGLALCDLDKVEDGVHHLRRACALAPTDPMKWDALCRILERQTKLDALETTLGEAMRHCPDNAILLLHRATLQSRRKHHADALATLLEIDADALPRHSQSLLSELRGRAYDGLGRQADAMRAFTAMNLAQASLHKVTRPLPYLSRLASRITGLPGFDATRWQTAPADHPPVFLVGFPRSGTTLLDSILRGHKDVAVVEEQPLIDHLTRGIPAENEAAALSQLSNAEIDARRTKYFRAFETQLGEQIGQRRAVDKMPLNMVEAGTIGRHFPDARFILALRHPADCVLSCFMQNFRPNDAMNTFLSLDTAAETYDRAFTLFEGYRKRLGLNVVEIRYEHLIRDLKGAVTPVLDYLGLDWRDEMADYQTTARARPVIHTPSYRQVTEDLYHNADGRWRQYKDSLMPVMQRLDPWIDRWGYAH